MRRELGSFRHLAARFARSLSPAGPPAADERWAREWLLPGERELWDRLPGPDRRHAVGVARDALERLGAEPPGRAVVAAALLHDVGKLESGLGTLGRVAVTLAAMLAGRERIVSGRGRSPWSVRARAYLTHDRIGGELLRAAGADALTAAWAEQHHLPAARWSIERRVGEALKAADGD